jgi:acyl carrier protein
MVSGLGTVLGTEVPTNTPLMSVGLDSIAAVEFTNAVSDELGMSFSAVMLFDHPTLDSIVSCLAGELEQDTVGHGVIRAVEGGALASLTVTREVALPSLVAVCFNVGGSMSSEAALRALVTRGQATPSGIPSTRWEARASGLSSAAAYGSFLDGAGV